MQCALMGPRVAARVRSRARHHPVGALIDTAGRGDHVVRANEPAMAHLTNTIIHDYTAHKPSEAYLHVPLPTSTATMDFSRMGKGGDSVDEGKLMSEVSMPGCQWSHG